MAGPCSLDERVVPAKVSIFCFLSFLLFLPSPPWPVLYYPPLPRLASVITTTVMPNTQRVPAPAAIAVAASPIHERLQRSRPTPTTPTTPVEKKRLSTSMLSVSSRASGKSTEPTSQHTHNAGTTAVTGAASGIAGSASIIGGADQQPVQQPRQQHSPLLSPSSPTFSSSTASTTPAQLVAAGYSSRSGARSEPPTPLQAGFELPTVNEDADPEAEAGPSTDLAPVLYQPPADKASRLLGIRHEPSMQPIPASARSSIAMSTRSAPTAGANAQASLPPVMSAPTGPTLPLASLYLVSGLAKSAQTWTLSDPDSTLGLHHSDGAVNRWWRPEVLGSTVSPSDGGAGKKGNKKKQSAEMLKGVSALSKQDVAKMLSKALKVS